MSKSKINCGLPAATAVLAGLLAMMVLPWATAGTGTKTVTAVTDNGNGSYKLTMASSSAVTVGDHFGARTGSTSGPGGLWEVMSKPDGTSVIVSETLTQENGTAFGVPIAGDAWYGTPTTEGQSRIPHLAKAYDAALRRNAYLTGKVTGGGTGASTAAGARTNLGLAIGTDVQAFDTQLSSLSGLSYSSNALKVVRVNAGENGFELTTPAGGETLAQTLALGADGNGVNQTNLGSLTLASGKTISLNGVLIQAASGSPEGVVSAPVGSLYSRTNGSTGTSLYIKESGSGNTGWVAVGSGGGGGGESLAQTLAIGADGDAIDQTNLGSLTLAANKSVTTSGTGDLAAGDDLTVADDATVTDVLTVNGNTNLGDATGDTVTISGPLSVNGGVGTADYYLASGGAGAAMEWKALPSGTTTLTVEDNTAGSGGPNQLTSGESSKVLTNGGATAENYEELPAATTGYRYRFVCKDTDGLRVTSVGDDTIRIGAYVTGAASYVNTTKIGNTLDLLAVSSTEWVALSWSGNWRIAGAAYACSPGSVVCLSNNATAVAQSATGDLQTFSLPAGQLQDEGDSIEVTWVVVSSGSPGGVVSFKFGSHSDATLNMSPAGTYVATARYTRTGATTQDVTLVQLADSSGIPYREQDTASETLSSAITIKAEVTTYSAGTATSELMNVTFYKAP